MVEKKNNKVNEKKWQSTGGAVVPVDINKVKFAVRYGTPKKKK